MWLGVEGFTQDKVSVTSSCPATGVLTVKSLRLTTAHPKLPAVQRKEAESSADDI